MKIHDRLVASLRAAGATDAPATRITKFTVLRLDVLFKRDKGDDHLSTKPSTQPRYWLVGRTGALRAVFGRPIASESSVVQAAIKAHLLATAPADVPRLEKPGRRRRPQ